MPFTPYHLGPGLFFGLLLFRYLDFPAFLIANIVVDVEPFLVLAFGLHQFLHPGEKLVGVERFFGVERNRLHVLVVIVLQAVVMMIVAMIMIVVRMIMPVIGLFAAE